MNSAHWEMSECADGHRAIGIMRMGQFTIMVMPHERSGYWAFRLCIDSTRWNGLMGACFRAPTFDAAAAEALRRFWRLAVDLKRMQLTGDKKR